MLCPPTSRLIVEVDLPITVAIAANVNPARHPFSIEARSEAESRKPDKTLARSITPPALMTHFRPAKPDAPIPTAAREGLRPPRIRAQNPRRTSRETRTPCGTAHTHSHQVLRSPHESAQ